jgi:enoyl-CoA hydratase/carnithine racemase
MISGQRYTAEQALAAEIVSEHRPEAEVLPAALKLAKSLAGKDRRTISMIKEGLYAEVLASIGAYAAR